MKFIPKKTLLTSTLLSAILAATFTLTACQTTSAPSASAPARKVAITDITAFKGYGKTHTVNGCPTCSITINRGNLTFVTDSGYRHTTSYEARPTPDGGTYLRFAPPPGWTGNRNPDGNIGWRG